MKPSKLMLVIGGWAACSSIASSANNTWTGAGGATWDVGTTASWQSPVTWTNADTAIFGTAGAGSVTVGTGVTAGGLTTNSGATGYVFSGEALAVTGNANINESARFDNSINFGATTALGAGKTLTLAGGGTLGGIRAGGGTASFVNFTAGAYTFRDSSFLGDAGLVNLNFTGSSTFSVGGNHVIGYSNPVTVTYNSSGTSTYTGFVNLGRGGNPEGTGTGSLVIQQGVINANGGIQVGGGANATVDVRGGTFNAGTQNVLINNNNAFTGLVNVQGGTFTAGTVQLNSATGGSSTFQLSSGTVNINNFTQANGGTKSIVLSGGTLGTNTVTAATWALGMNLNGDVNIRAANAAGTSANIALSGQLSGSGGFTKTGGGTLTLSGNNTYSGATTISSGAVVAASANALGTGNINLGDAILTLGVANVIADTATLFFGVDSSIALNYTGDDTVLALTNTTTSQTIGAGTWTADELNVFFGGTYFTGSGTITTVIPEPGSAALTVLGALSLFRLRRR